MLSWLTRKSASASLLGGAVRDDGICLLTRKGELVQMDGWRRSEWAELAKKAGPARLQWVLTDPLYQIHAVDRPKVEESELAAALPFAVKDLVNLPIERIHLDYFQLAVQPSGSDKLQVVVADKQHLARLAKAQDDAGFNAGLITIEELALVNLLPVHARPQMLLWHRPNQPLKLLIGTEGQLLLSRHIRGFNQLDLLSESELEQGLVDALILELQRSIDYLDRQLHQPAIAGITLVLPLPQQQILHRLLESQLEVPIFAMTTDEHPVDHWLAHGAALERADEASS
ncbi:hypothetical protein KUV89_11660 [Marinobacter hydrocarbonoclasticus]|nr:hypothetical protein [Marinobacter nauticus]